MSGLTPLRYSNHNLARAVPVARRLVAAFPDEPLYVKQLEQLEAKVRSRP